MSASAGKAQIWKSRQKTAKQLRKLPAPVFRIAEKAGNIVDRMRAYDDRKAALDGSAGGADRFFHGGSHREGRFQRDVALEHDHRMRPRNPSPAGRLRRFDAAAAPDSECRVVGPVSGCTGRHRRPPKRAGEQAYSRFDPALLIGFGQKAFIAVLDVPPARNCTAASMTPGTARRDRRAAASYRRKRKSPSAVSSSPTH